MKYTYESSFVFLTIQSGDLQGSTTQHSPLWQGRGLRTFSTAVLRSATGSIPTLRLDSEKRSSNLMLICNI